MSTRSVTTLCDNDTAHCDKLVALYRHSDGYLAEAGATLVEAMRDAKNATEVAARLLAHTYEATSYRPAKRVYELTTNAEDHGDIEHEYRVWHTRDGWRIGHKVRESWGDEAKWSAESITDLPTFASKVNADRRAINARIENMRAKQPQAYADVTGYPMIPEALTA